LTSSKKKKETTGFTAAWIEHTPKEYLSLVKIKIPNSKDYAEEYVVPPGTLVRAPYIRCTTCETWSIFEVLNYQVDLEEFGVSAIAYNIKCVTCKNTQVFNDVDIFMCDCNKDMCTEECDYNRSIVVRQALKLII
jgi:hypothetical protein